MVTNECCGDDNRLPPLSPYNHHQYSPNSPHQHHQQQSNNLTNVNLINGHSTSPSSFHHQQMNNHFQFGNHATSTPITMTCPNVIFFLIIQILLLLNQYPKQRKNNNPKQIANRNNCPEFGSFN